MRAEYSLPVHTLAAFLLVMARMGGLTTFLPMPGLKTGPDVSRVVLAVACTFLLFPVWAHASGPLTAPENFLAGIVSEALLGLAVGVAVSYLSEFMNMAAQMFSLQAGYSYAVTIDPNTEAEAGYLVVLTQLFSGLLFFACGIDRQVLAILGRSFERVPPGGLTLSPTIASSLAEAFGTVFSMGLRLALPIIALLAMTDITLSLLGRLNSQLHVTTLAFPAKMLAALGLLAWLAGLMPTIFQQYARQILTLIEHILRVSGG